MVVEDEAEEDKVEDDGGAVMADGKSRENELEGIEAVGRGDMISSDG
jgi:hypothetical protein